MTQTPGYMSPVLIQSVNDALTRKKQSAGEIARKTGIPNPRRMLNYLKREGTAQSRFSTSYHRCEEWFLSPKPQEAVTSCSDCSSKRVKDCLGCQVI